MFKVRATLSQSVSTVPLALFGSHLKGHVTLFSLSLSPSMYPLSPHVFLFSFKGYMKWENNPLASVQPDIHVMALKIAFSNHWRLQTVWCLGQHVVPRCFVFPLHGSLATSGPEACNVILNQLPGLGQVLPAEAKGDCLLFSSPPPHMCYGVHLPSIPDSDPSPTPTRYTKQSSPTELKNCPFCPPG